MIRTQWIEAYYKPTAKPRLFQRGRSVSASANERVLQAVKDGARVAKEIALLSGMAESSVRRNLYYLRDMGEITATETHGKQTIWRSK